MKHRATLPALPLLFAITLTAGCEPCPDCNHQHLAPQIDAPPITPPGVNAAALMETKTGDPCPTCPPTTWPPANPQPQPTTPQQTDRPPALDEVKTGAFTCANCKRPKIGALFHTSYTDSPLRLPVTFLCLDCWHSMTPEQRLESFRGWADRQQISARSEAVFADAVTRDK